MLVPIKDEAVTLCVNLGTFDTFVQHKSLGVLAQDSLSSDERKDFLRLMLRLCPGFQEIEDLGPSPRAELAEQKAAYSRLMSEAQGTITSLTTELERTRDAYNELFQENERLRDELVTLKTPTEPPIALVDEVPPELKDEEPCP